VPARHEQREERERRATERVVVGGGVVVRFVRRFAVADASDESVRFHVVHRHDGQPVLVTQVLRLDDAHAQAHGQPGADGDGHRGEFFWRNVRGGERARHDVVDGAFVRLAREVGHDPPPARVDLALARERLAQHAPVARDHGGAGVVAAGLDAEDHGARAHGHAPASVQAGRIQRARAQPEPGAAVGRVRRRGAHDGRRGGRDAGRARGEAPGRRPARAWARRPRVRVAARADDVSAGRRGGGDFSRDPVMRVTPRVRGERHARARRERAHRHGAARYDLTRGCRHGREAGRHSRARATMSRRRGSIRP
jgi:hypothetical protein